MPSKYLPEWCHSVGYRRLSSVLNKTLCPLECLPFFIQTIAFLCVFVQILSIPLPFSPLPQDFNIFVVPFVTGAGEGVVHIRQDLPPSFPAAPVARSGAEPHVSRLDLRLRGDVLQDL